MRFLWGFRIYSDRPNWSNRVQDRALWSWWCQKPSKSPISRNKLPMTKLSIQKVLNYRVLSEMEVDFMVPMPLPKRCTVGVKLPRWSFLENFKGLQSFCSKFNGGSDRRFRFQIRSIFHGQNTWKTEREFCVTLVFGNFFMKGKTFSKNVVP